MSPFMFIKIMANKELNKSFELWIEQLHTTEIIIKNWQIKSLKKAKILAKALDIIEKEIGIHIVKITLDTMFICPDIDKSKLNKTPMEKNVRDILYILDWE